MGKFWYIVGIYEVRLNRRIDIEEDDQYGVEALETCQERVVKWWSGWARTVMKSMSQSSI
jgi:hypothetical protein